MPSKLDYIAIDNVYIDKRTRLLPCQKEMVFYWYNAGMSITSIAKLFKVNKRSIQFLLFPERKVKNLADREARGGTKQYYNKDKQRIYIRDHREHKKQLHNKGLI